MGAATGRSALDQPRLFGCTRPQKNADGTRLAQNNDLPGARCIKKRALARKPAQIAEY
jgi:hypothetical protein